MPDTSANIIADCNIISKQQPVNYLVYKDSEYHLNTLIDILYDLYETDGFFNNICINDSRIEQFLLDIDIINKTNKGGCYIKDKDHHKHDDLLNYLLGVYDG